MCVRIFKYIGVIKDAGKPFFLYLKIKDDQKGVSVANWLTYI